MHTSRSGGTAVVLDGMSSSSSGVFCASTTNRVPASYPKDYATGQIATLGVPAGAETLQSTVKDKGAVRKGRERGETRRDEEDETTGSLA
jgi:hypothetical protein